MAEKPKYQLNTDTFIEPNLLKADTVIYYEGPFGPHMTPLNDEAKAKAEAYYAANPSASLQPVEALPLTFAEVVAAASQVAGPVDVGSTIAGSQDPSVQAVPQDANVASPAKK